LKPVTPAVVCATITDVLEEDRVAAALRRQPFVVGDLVTTARNSDWIGQVVDTSRLADGYVVVRWRTSSGMWLRAREESIRLVVRVGPLT
jgi:hypothetical protein